MDSSTINLLKPSDTIRSRCRPKVGEGPEGPRRNVEALSSCKESEQPDLHRDEISPDNARIYATRQARWNFWPGPCSGTRPGCDVSGKLNETGERPNKQGGINDVERVNRLLNCCGHNGIGATGTRSPGRRYLHLAHQ